MTRFILYQLKCKFLYFLLTASLFVFVNQLGAQSVTCGIDTFMDYMLQNDPVNYYEMEVEMNEIFNQMINSNQNEGSPVTIPVLVHIIHEGESIGNGTNISYAQVESAIDDLNNVFSNSNGPGANLEISFCLAQRTPENTPFPIINGIQENGVLRADGSGVGGYGTTGITGGNEADIKALTSSNSSDYYNIWIVNEIENNNGGSGVQGYAYFPGAPSNLDGAVILYNAFGTTGNLKSYTNLNTVAVHEIGHSFGLYHTFQGDSGGASCPFEGICDATTGISPEGDMCCDTPPHIRNQSTCPSGATNNCANTATDPNDIYDVTDISYIYNYMNYSSQTCVDRFTQCQKDRISCTMHSTRNSLTYSAGCLPACDLVASDYIHTETNTVEIGDFTLFEDMSEVFNGSTPTFEWLVDGEVLGTQSSFLHTFAESGNVRVCLDVTVDNCMDRYCETFRVLIDAECSEELNECEYLLNGNFSEKSFDETNIFYRDVFDSDEKRICNWDQFKGESTSFVSKNGIDFITLVSAADNNILNGSEDVVTQSPLNLVDGIAYDIYLEYICYVRGTNTDSEPTLNIYLSTSPDESIASTTIIKEELVTTQPGTWTNELVGLNFNPNDRQPFYFSYTHDESNGEYLILENEIKNITEDYGWSALLITNISVTKCCELDPMFTYDGDCSGMSFNPSNNNGDDVIYFWNFGDGTISDLENPIHEFQHEGTHTVCLTVKCPENLEGLGLTYCTDIYIAPNDLCQCIYTQDERTATICEGEESYEASVCFEIPAGATACDGSETPYIFSDNTDITLNDYEPLDPFSGNDQYCVSINMTPDPNGDFETEGENIYLHVCDEEGNPICITSTINPVQCASCETLDIRVFALCDLDKSTGGVSVFEGTIELPGGLVDCGLGGSAEASGFEVGDITSNPNSTSVDFTITTDNSLNSPFDATIPLCDQNGEVTCYQIRIYPVQCPVECPVYWDKPKTLTCNESSIPGYVSYNFSMTFDKMPFGWCQEGLLGHIDGNGNVNINSFSSTQQPNGTYIIEFDIDITMPCGTVFGEEYNLYLYGCYYNNLPACYYFQLIFEECECEETDGDRNGEGRSIDERSLASDENKVYPNPAQDKLTVLLNKLDYMDNSNFVINLYNTNGQLILSELIDKRMTSIDISKFQSGVYLVNIQSDKKSFYSKRLIIMK